MNAGNVQENNDEKMHMPDVRMFETDKFAGIHGVSEDMLKHEEAVQHF